MPLIEKAKTDAPISNGNSNINGDEDLVENDDQFGLTEKPTRNSKQVRHGTIWAVLIYFTQSKKTIKTRP